MSRTAHSHTAEIPVVTSTIHPKKLFNSDYDLDPYFSQNNVDH